MNNFQYYNQTRFIFGKGEEDHAGTYIKEYGAEKVMILHYGTDMKFETDLIDRVKESIKQAGLTFYDFTGIQPNPDIGKALEAVEIIRAEKIDFLLPVGGGSVIDTAKFAAIAAEYEGDVWQDCFLDRKPVPAPILLGAISTIAASGSENSPDAVIANQGLKRSISDSKLRPVFAIMDPELSFTLPPKLTAAGAADIIAHAHERYFTPVPDNYFTDQLNESVIRTVIKYAPVALKEPDNYNARAQLLWAGLLAHNGMFEVGRTIDGAVHCIESEIGGLYHSTHGTGCGCVTMAWAQYVYKRDIPRFVGYFNRVWGVEIDAFNPEDMIEEGLRRMREFYLSLGIPASFKELGVKEEDIGKLISTTRVTPAGLTGGFSKLTRNDLREIYKIGMESK